MTDTEPRTLADEGDGMTAEVETRPAGYPYGEMDATKWAAEYKRLFPESDEGLMLGWFANAIMTGFDEASRRSEARATAPAGLDVETFTGILGWSNKRTGVEFYRSWDEGRWGKRQSNYDDSAEPERGGWGVLLADDIETRLQHAEGRAVVVLVAKDRRTTGDSIRAALAADSEPER